MNEIVHIFKNKITQKKIDKLGEKVLENTEIKIIKVHFKNAKYDSFNSMKQLEHFFDFVFRKLNAEIIIKEYSFDPTDFLYPIHSLSAINCCLYQNDGVLRIDKKKYIKYLRTNNKKLQLNNEIDYIKYFFTPELLKNINLDSEVSSEIMQILIDRGLPTRINENVTLLVADLISNLVNHVNSFAFFEFYSYKLNEKKTGKSVHCIVISCHDLNEETLIEKMETLYKEKYFKKYFPNLNDKLESNNLDKAEYLLSAFQMGVSSKKVEGFAGGTGLPSILGFADILTDNEQSIMEINCENICIKFRINDLLLDDFNYIGKSKNRLVDEKYISSTNLTMSNGLLISTLLILEEENENYKY